MIFCASANFSGAQKTLSFSSQNYAGLLEGDNGSALNLQSVNGINYKKWFSGVGVGIDYYRIRSVPLFLSVNRNIEIGQNIFYITADGGWNFPWLRENEQTWNGSNFKVGIIAGTGVGYKILINESKQALLLNAGYSFKRLNDTRDIPSPCLIPPCPVDIEKTRYDFNRFLVRAGIEF
jgi:hypothetical protein